MEYPCKDCIRRNIGCHSSCPDYKEFKIQLERKKAEDKVSNVYDDYIKVKRYNKPHHKRKEDKEK
jgi:hypothetical protein